MISISWEKIVDNKKLLFLFAAVISCIVLFHRLGDSPLGGDDSYYSEVAKEMSITHDYMTPQYNHVKDFHTSKPPMLFWMNALSGNIFSFNNFAMRLPSALLGFIGVMSLMFFVNRYINFYSAFISALILTFTQQYLYHSRSAVTDGPFSVFFALALMSFWIAKAEKKIFFFYLMGLFAGLAVMTRQIPGLFVFAVILTYIAISRATDILKNPHFYFGIILTFAIIMPWHILMYLKHGNEFLMQYFNVAFMTAFKGYPVEYSGNPSLNPWYAYFQILINNYWPWLPFLAIGIYSFIKKYKQHESAYKDFMLFIFLWAFIPFLIFQIAKVKQYHYINPLYFPFAVISAGVFNGFSKGAKIKAAKYFVVLTAVLAGIYTAYPVIPKTLDSREYIDTIKLVPQVREIKDDLIVLNEGFCHYDNCFMFYADKGVIVNSRQEMLEKIDSNTRYSFVLSKENFADISKSVRQNNINIIKYSEKSVLFSNYK